MMQGLSNVSRCQARPPPQHLSLSACNKVNCLQHHSLRRNGGHSHRRLPRFLVLQIRVVEEPHPSARGGDLGHLSQLQHHSHPLVLPPRHCRVLSARSPQVGLTRCPSRKLSLRLRLSLCHKRQRGASPRSNPNLSIEQPHGLRRGRVWRLSTSLGIVTDQTLWIFFGHPIYGLYIPVSAWVGLMI